MNKDLLPFDDALTALLTQAAPVDGRETVPITDALDRVVAADVCSALDVPPADNSQMDGWAVRSCELQALDAGTAPVRLRVGQRVPAGMMPEPLAPGRAARIFTGAVIPVGADAVVMQEQASVDGSVVSIAHRPAPGEWIRRAGEDIRAGSIILAEGARITPQSIGLAASVGIAQLEVRRRVRVGCFFTGDELVMPGEPLPPGAIYNSNRFVLTALLRRYGCEVVDLGIVPDSLEATRAALRAAARENDLIVTSGGMSVGEEDHVRPAVQAEGRLDLWQIAVKPGKPLAYGRVRQGAVDTPFAHFIGLPGNPVSAFVTFLLFVRPFLLRLQGVADVAPQAIPMRADFDWARPDRRREFLRARFNGQGGLDLFPNQGPGVLTSTVWADGLVDNPPSNAIRRGEVVRFLPFAALLG